MALGIKRIDKNTLNERVYDELRRAIISGRFQPGMTVTLRALAAQVGTSEMPVRDAVRRLVVERALVSRANRTVMVPILDEATFQEICEIRMQLETLATRKAVGQLQPSDFTALRTIIQAMAESKTCNKYLALNQGFHFRIYEAAQRPMLLSMIESIWMQTGPLMNVVELTTGKTEAETHHAEVVNALERGDADAAAVSIAADIDGAAKFISQWIREQTES
ncbi:MAG: GntR family transcriptional regulator [Xanthomonadales bacterium]|nr:GntR family transcriptional regulator [Xanthomonadales bacterium]